MENFPRLSRIDWLIVDLLAEAGANPLYGLQLVEKSNEKLKRGTVYVNLAKLEDLGLIKVSVGPPRGTRGRPRNQYTLSGKGRRALAARDYLNGLSEGLPA